RRDRRLRMVVAADLAGGRGDCLMAERQRRRNECLDPLATDALRWSGIVIAQHPDEPMLFRHSIQPCHFAARKTPGTFGVVKRITEGYDHTWAPATQQQRQPIQRGVRVPWR